ncbi:MAG: J domain-containing protein, partial [Nitrospirae bacterium]|nr:J domain-containing protein [Nitrospirota bacterium]
MTEPFQEAVRLIVRLYREPDLLRRLRETPEQIDHLLEAIVEIAKGEESDVAGKIAEVADPLGVDAKSVVDGANFLLSLLHAGPEGNPYRVLGLDRNASQEAIKRRWRLLMQIYHPDRYPDPPDWVAERAKQINEAYTLLRDEEEKRRLDAELTSVPHASRFTPHATPAAAARAGRPAGSGISWSLYFTPAWRRRLPRLMMATLLGGAAIIVAIVYLSNYPAPTDVGVKVARKEVKSQKSEVRSEKTSPTPLLTKEGKGEVESEASGARSEKPGVGRPTPDRIGTGVAAESGVRSEEKGSRGPGVQESSKSQPSNPRTLEPLTPGASPKSDK